MQVRNLARAVHRAPRLTHFRSLVWLLLAFTPVAACGSTQTDTSDGAGAGGDYLDGTGATSAGSSGSVGLGGETSGSAMGSADELVTTLEGDGFEVSEGKFRLLDLSQCCDEGKSCAGNNPSSPYCAYYLPRAPQQTAPNDNEDADGLSNSYRLAADEAVVWIGETPPEAAYFGFTDYLMSRDDGSGDRGSVFASLGETLNNGVLGVAGPSDGVKFGRQAMVIHTPDAGIAERIKRAALRAGVEEAAINIAPIDAESTRLGLEASADTLGVLFRSALYTDEAAGERWLSVPPAYLFRVTPVSEPTETAPYGKAPTRPKDAETDENSTYAEAATELERAIIEAYATTHDAIVEPMTEGTPDPYACIAGERSCAGDNRDTIYPATSPFLWPVRLKDFLIVHGVDHSQTGKATYANASLYAVQHLAGVAAVSSKSWSGSAARYLPDHPLADKLYAYKIARACNGDEFCLEVPAAPCPGGIAPGALAVVAFRAYLEPTSNTGPDPALLVPDGVLRFKTR